MLFVWFVGLLSVCGLVIAGWFDLVGWLVCFPYLWMIVATYFVWFVWGCGFASNFVLLAVVCKFMALLEFAWV